MHYGGTQVAVGVVFVAIALLLAAVFVAVALHARREVPLERVQARGYGLRNPWIAFLAALLVVCVGGAALLAPYPGGAAGSRTVVQVTAGQFFWSFDPPQVPPGTHVRFDVTSVDVNHGFGLYDPHGVLMGSVQAMPGYHNRLDLTLTDPGSYRVLCMEFCGVKHHAMESVFRVAAA
jgi:cytochrome c oxidase subunit 2